jgi:RNA-directed DNA polymerase
VLNLATKLYISRQGTARCSQWTKLNSRRMTICMYLNLSTHLLPYMHGFELLWHTDIPIRRLVKVQGNRSPYDGDWVYWSQRSGKSPLVSTRVATLLRRQQGKCTYCGKFFIPNDLMEVDHIIPQSKGGKDSLDHLQLLHRHCHDLKTAEDGSLGCTHDKGCSREKPYAGKVSCTVWFRRWRKP